MTSLFARRISMQCARSGFRARPSGLGLGFALAATVLAGAGACAPAPEADEAAESDAIASASAALTPTDADFDTPTCGIQDFTPAQLRTVLGGQPWREFTGMTVRSRTRRCVARTETGAATCAAWEPTVSRTNRDYSLAIYRNPGGGWVKPTRYVKFVGGSSLDPATFRVRYSDPDLTPFVVEGSSLTDTSSDLYCDAAQSRSNELCVWVKGRMRSKKRTPGPDGYAYQETEILYTASGYTPKVT